MNRLLVVLFISFFVCFQSAFGTEAEQAIKRVQAHLIIKDYASAYEEAKQSLVVFPDSSALHEGQIRALAKLGNEREMLSAWNQYVERFPDKSQQRDLIEEMSWGVLNKASHSYSLIIRLMSLLAAYFSHDAKGVDILYQSLHDSNSSIRSVGVQLAGHCRDAKLLDEMRRLFKEEYVWSVRKEVIKAIGQMKIIDLRPDLEALIASDQSLAEEKAMAIESLVKLLDEIKREEIARLASSNRAGLRLLACQAVAHFHSLRDKDWMIHLANDSHPDVRIAAFQSLGQLRPKEEAEEILNLARRGTQATNSKVAISAAWLMTLYSPEEGQQVLAHYLMSDRRDVRILAASALAATGHYGVSLAWRVFEQHDDPYIRLNLALGLVGQRVAIKRTVAVIDEVFNTEKDKWVWVEQGIFRAVAPRTIKKSESEATSTPEMDNQLVRLEILNLMAVLQSSTAQESIRRFLAEKTWGISGVAAALLLMEGNDAAVDLVQTLLQDSDAKIRLQAALVLSLWSREENAIQVLEQEYWEANKELKGRILEGLGRIGSMRSVPFLIEALEEPSQTLRIIAAMALIQCANH